MASTKSIKITFSLDEEDQSYFRRLLRETRKAAKDRPRDEVIGKARDLVKTVREEKRAPHFVTETIEVLESLIGIIEDEDYAVPKSIGDQVVATLAYFAEAEDLIPDNIPGLGFLDDAIMIKIVEQQFKEELWGYNKFKKYRAGAEQRPWTTTARTRLPRKLEEKRREIRGDIEKRKAKAGIAW